MHSVSHDEIPYQQRIEALTQSKLEHNRAKLERDGYHDIDDHGNIYWPDPIPFTPQSNHPSGGCYGIKCIGENFRAWLDVHPVYIHPMSSLAGAWAGFLRGVGGWKPEDRPHHLAPLHEKYNLGHNGIGAMNHLGPGIDPFGQKIVPRPVKIPNHHPLNPGFEQGPDHGVHIQGHAETGPGPTQGQKTGILIIETPRGSLDIRNHQYVSVQEQLLGNLWPRAMGCTTAYRLVSDQKRLFGPMLLRGRSVFVVLKK